jgi:APA family basic amino acid/polyamine antiporter
MADIQAQPPVQSPSQAPASGQTAPTGEMKATLGLTGLTSNAMALIAPGALMWLTFFIQSTTRNTGPAMWMGIVGAVVLCLSIAVCYAELAKLYPGTGSSYYFAEQAFLNRDRAWRYARISKFIVGWASHLYYWIYPGVMVGTMGILCGYVVGTVWPGFMSASNPGILFMMAIAVVFSFAIAYIAHRGINSSTSINFAINVIQITALVIFSVFAIQYRLHHPPGSVAYQFDSVSGEAYQYEFQTAPVTTPGVNGAPATTVDTIVRDANGVPLPKLDAHNLPTPFHISYDEHDAAGNFLAHPSAFSVIRPHDWNWVFVQVTIAILILVGFESVTTMGGEAKNAKRDVPIAVLASLLIQGVVFYFFSYFASNYFLNSGYTMQSAAGSAAPIGDMMVIVGDAIFGQGHGRTFMLVEAFTVFLALIGTALSCINTGARVTYAMGKDREIRGHFGLLHNRNLTPHRAIWTLATISAVIGCVAVSLAFADGGAPTDASIASIPHGLLSSFGYTTHDKLAALPNSLLTVTLASNFGTFLLYALSCITCMVAYHKHEKYSLLRHTLIPLFGLLASIACMAFYIIGPYFNFGTPHEPLLALAIAAIWGLYGGFYFLTSGKAEGKTAMLQTKTPAA